MLDSSVAKALDALQRMDDIVEEECRKRVISVACHRTSLLTVPDDILVSILKDVFDDDEKRGAWLTPGIGISARCSVMSTCRQLNNFVKRSPALWRLIPTNANRRTVERILYANKHFLHIDFSSMGKLTTFEVVAKVVTRWKSLSMENVRLDDWDLAIGILFHRIFGRMEPLPNILHLCIRTGDEEYEANANDVLRWLRWSRLQTLTIKGGSIPCSSPKFDAMRKLTIVKAFEAGASVVNALIKFLQHTPNLVELRYKERRSRLNKLDLDQLEETDLLRLRKLHIQVTYDGRKEKGIFLLLSKLTNAIFAPSLVDLSLDQQVVMDQLEDDALQNAINHTNGFFKLNGALPSVRSVSISFHCTVRLKDGQHWNRMRELSYCFTTSILNKVPHAHYITIKMIYPPPIIDLLPMVPLINKLTLRPGKRTSSDEVQRAMNWLEAHRDTVNTFVLDTAILYGSTQQNESLPAKRPTIHHLCAGLTSIIWNCEP